MSSGSRSVGFAIVTALCGAGTVSQAQIVAPLSFDQGAQGDAVAGLIRKARSLSAAQEQGPRPARPITDDASLACFQALDGYSYGMGALLTLSENAIILPSKNAASKGFYLLHANGSRFVPLPAPPARSGFTNYQFELPIRFADSERKATYLMYGYNGDRENDLHPFLVAWRDPQKGENYTPVALEEGRYSAEALEALREALIERLGTMHEHFSEYRPRRKPAEYLEHLDGCASVQDERVRKAVGLEKSKF
jgi:hypothetical protein